MTNTKVALGSRAPLFLLLGYLLLTLPFVDRYPSVWVDEGWIAEVAAQLAQGLPPGSPSHGTTYRYADRLFWMPPLYFYELGGVFRLAGVDLVAGRLFNVFLGGLTTLALFVFLRRRTGDLAAIPAALFFAADTFVWKAHRTIRFEALLTLFGVLLFFTLLRALEREEEERPARGFWLAAGLLAGLAVNVHPNGALLAVAAALVVLKERGLRALRGAGPWLALAAGLILLLPYTLYCLSDAREGFVNLVGQNSFHLEAGGGEGPALLREWRRWSSYFEAPARTPLLAAWIAIVALALRRAGRRETGAALVFLGVVATALAFLPNKTLLYLVMAAPFVAILGALVLAEPRPAWVRLLLPAGIALSLVTNGLLLWRNRDCRPVEELARIRAELRPGDRVAGTYVTWWAVQPLPFHEFSRGDTPEAVAAFAPTVILLGDRQWRQEAAGRFGPLERQLLGPGGPLHEREPELDLSGSCLGPVRLYRLPGPG